MAAPVWRKRGYISKAGSDSQLRKKLKIVSNGLKGIKQLEDDEDQSELAYLEGVCNEIVADEVLAHTNQEVRLLAMCCLVDVLRIYAPNAPFDDVQIQRLFIALIDELKNLKNKNDPLFKNQFYILESLADVRSCYLVHECDEDLVLEMIECMLDTASDALGPKALQHMYTIVTICLDDEDEEEVPLPVCATIVGRLCKGTKASTEEARKLAKECLRSSVPLQLTSGQLVLEIFRGSETPCVKELRPKLEALVDVLMYYSEAMLRVIPGLTSGIQAEEVKDRLRIIGMLGRIYSIEADEKDIPLPAAHPALCYAEAHIQQHFGTAFLNRFNDVHPKVRIAMCEVGARIMLSKPGVASAVAPHLNTVLEDAQDSVRLAALQAVADVSFQSPSAARALTEATADLLSQRMRDNKSAIRTKAVVAVGKIFHTACSDIDDEDELSKVLLRTPFEVLRGLGACAKQRDGHMTNFFRTFDELVLPDSASQHTEARTRALLTMHERCASRPSWLDADAATQARIGLEALLSGREQLQGHMLRFLNAREQAKAAEDEATAAAAAADDDDVDVDAMEEEKEEDDEDDEDDDDVEAKSPKKKKKKTSRPPSSAEVSNKKKSPKKKNSPPSSAEVSNAIKALAGWTSVQGVKGRSRADINKLINALHKMKDQSVFKRLKKLCDPSTRACDVPKLKSSLLKSQSVTTCKLDVAKWLKETIIEMRMSTIDAGGFRLIFTSLALDAGAMDVDDDDDDDEEDEDEEAQHLRAAKVLKGVLSTPSEICNALRLCSVLTKHFPVLLQTTLFGNGADVVPGAMRSLLSFAESDNDAVSVQAIKLISLAAAGSRDRTTLDSSSLRACSKLTNFCKGRDGGDSVADLKGAAQSDRALALNQKATSSATALVGFLRRKESKLKAVVGKVASAGNLDATSPALGAVLSALHVFATETRSIFARTNGTEVITFVQQSCLDAETSDLLPLLNVATTTPTKKKQKKRKSSRQSVTPNALHCGAACSLAASGANALFRTAAKVGNVDDRTSLLAFESLRLLVQMIKICDDDTSEGPLATCSDQDRAHIASVASKAAFKLAIDLNLGVTQRSSDAMRLRFTSLICALMETVSHSTWTVVQRNVAAAATRHAIARPDQSWVLGFCAVMMTSEDSEQQKLAKKALAASAKAIAKKRARNPRISKNPRALAEYAVITVVHVIARLGEFDALRGASAAMTKRVQRAFSALFDATMSTAATGGARKSADSAALTKKLLEAIRSGVLCAETIHDGEEEEEEEDDDAVGKNRKWSEGLVTHRSAARHAAQLSAVVELAQNALLRAPSYTEGANEHPGKSFIPTWLFSIVAAPPAAGEDGALASISPIPNTSSKKAKGKKKTKKTEKGKKKKKTASRKSPRRGGATDTAASDNNSENEESRAERGGKGRDESQSKRRRTKVAS